MKKLKRKIRETIHPSKCKREAQAESQKELDAANKRAEHQRVVAETLKTTRLAALETDYTTRTTEANDYFAEQNTTATTDWENVQASYLTACAELESIRSSTTADIEKSYLAQLDSLADERTSTEELLKKCKSIVHKRAARAKTFYGYEVTEIGSLFDQVRQDMLHQQALDSYISLKDPVLSNSRSKSKNLSFLIAYFKILHKQGAIEPLQQQQYCEFVYALANSILQPNHDYINIDQKITSLFSVLVDTEQANINVACAHDLENSKIRSNIGLKEFQAISSYLESKLNRKQLGIELWRSKELRDVRLAYTENLKHNKDKYFKGRTTHLERLRDIDLRKKNSLADLKLNKKLDTKQINDGLAADLQEIDRRLNEEKNAINQDLEQTIKQLNNAWKATLINAATAVAAGAAAYFSGGLLSSAGAWVANTVQTSLAVTSLASLERLLNGRAEIGLSVHAQLPSRDPRREYTRRHSNRTTNTNNSEQPTFSLDAMRQRMDDTRARIKVLEEQVETDLFYSLPRTTPRTQSNTMVQFGGAQPRETSQFVFRTEDVLSFNVNFGENQKYVVRATPAQVKSFFHGMMHKRGTAQSSLAETDVTSSSARRLLVSLGGNVVDVLISSANASEPGNTSSVVPRKHFSLKTALPASSDNKILGFLYAGGRGIERGRDSVTDALLHPVESLASTLEMVWDGVNVIAEVTFNVSTHGARARNQQRGRALNDTASEFQEADGVRRTEMLSQFATTGVLGYALFGAGRGVVGRYSGGNPAIKHVNPAEIGFSQSTVSSTKLRINPVTKEKTVYTFDEIVSSMKTKGWQGEPINIVKMPDGSLTAIDNTRLLAARKAGIEAKVKIHDYDAPIPKNDARNYTAAGKMEPVTWGEAIHSRIRVQIDVYFQDRTFAEKFPNGSAYDPKLTSRGPQ